MCKTVNHMELKTQSNNYESLGRQSAFSICTIVNTVWVEYPVEFCPIEISEASNLALRLHTGSTSH